jgi:hypothetical protein
LSLPAGGYELGYSFLALSIPSRSEPLLPKESSDAMDRQKYLFLHRIELSWPRFSLSLSESNLVAGNIVDFQDFGPFLVYHNLYRGKSNVTLDLDMRFRPTERMILFGEVILDDMAVGSEAEDPATNPPAMGFMTGLEWKIFGGSRNIRPAMLRSDQTLRIGYAQAGYDGEGGLAFRAEAYLCSTYLYRRRLWSETSPLSPWQTFTTHYFLQTGLTDTWPDVDSWLAAPLSPDTALARLGLVYNVSDFEASLTGEYWLRGSESGTDLRLFDPAAKRTDWLWPQAPLTRVLELKAEGRWRPQPTVLLLAGAGLRFGDEGFGWSMGAGAGLRLGAGAMTGSR